MHLVDNPDISVLVVGFNSAGQLARCFLAIEKAVVDCKAEVLFTNNGSDRSEVLIRDRFPWVQIVESRGNIGFAAANNYLARVAIGRYLLLVNPDTEIDCGAPRMLLRTAQNEPRYGILGGTTVFASEPGRELPELTLPSTYRLLRETFAGPRANRRTKGGIRPVEATSGGFMMVERQLWRQLEGMDERFFLYAEDLDLCKRAAEANADIVEVSEAKILHDVGGGSFFSPMRQLFQAKGNATYQWKHCFKAQAITNIGLIWLRMAIRAFGAGILAPVSTKHRLVFKALSPLALKPWQWVSGYRR